jgi:hypothetical protein
MLEQKKLQLEGHAESLDRSIRTISRQLELRRQEIEGLSGGRGYNPQNAVRR